jgi:hypothetical protein
MVTSCLITILSPFGMIPILNCAIQAFPIISRKARPKIFLRSGLWFIKIIYVSYKFFNYSFDDQFVGSGGVVQVPPVVTATAITFTATPELAAVNAAVLAWVI